MLLYQPSASRSFGRSGEIGGVVELPYPVGSSISSA